MRISTSQFYESSAANYQKNFANAVKNYEQAIRLDYGDHLPHLKLGTLLMENGKSGRALTEFELAIKFGATEPLVHYNYGLALNDVGRKRYPRLLPVFKGALAGSGLDIGAYLELRDSVASEFAKVSSNLFVRRFVLGASAHSGFVGDNGQPTPRSLTNEQCRAQVLAYLESGQHASLEEEIWLGVFGLVFRSME